MAAFLDHCEFHMKYFVINAKNYSEVAGKGLENLVATVKTVARKSEFNQVAFYLAPPNFGLGLSGGSVSNYGVLSQHVDLAKVGPSTGYSVAEIAKSFGAVGSIINHSEHRIDENEIAAVVSRLRQIGMLSIVCAKDDQEVSKFSGYSPDFIAVEPPELIGSGMAVSKVKPEIIIGSRNALEKARPAGSSTRLLCGAGIVGGVDARMSIELGAEGILVASGVIKASNWSEKIEELAQGLIDAPEPGSDR
jgi:triosephosphate isomerase